MDVREEILSYLNGLSSKRKVREVVVCADEAPQPGLGLLQYTKAPYFKWVLSGKMMLHEQGKSPRRLQPDDVCLFEADSYVNLFFPERVEFLRITFGADVVHIGLEAIDPANPCPGGTALGRLRSVFREDCPPAIIPQLLDRLRHWAACGQSHRAVVAATGLLVEMAGWLETGSDGLSGRVHEILHYIRSRSHLPINLESSARDLGATPRHINRLLSTQNERTFNHLLQEQRMVNARRLLETTHLSIEAIALACGFTGASYFSQAFKRCHGKSPLAWRLHPDGLADS